MVAVPALIVDNFCSVTSNDFDFLDTCGAGCSGDAMEDAMGDAMGDAMEDPFLSFLLGFTGSFFKSGMVGAESDKFWPVTIPRIFCNSA